MDTATAARIAALPIDLGPQGAAHLLGRRVVVGPAYSMDTRSRSIQDQITGAYGIVTHVYRDYCDVTLDNGRDENVHGGRLLAL